MNAPIKEHGLLFRGAMCRQLLADCKRETRRPVTAHNSVMYDGERDEWVAIGRAWPSLDWSKVRVATDGDVPNGEACALVVGRIDGEPDVWLMPRVQQGHPIWVKETWKSLGHPRRLGAEVHYEADGYDPSSDYEARTRHRVIVERVDDARYRPGRFGAWRSSMLMPRWASRIALDVTEPTLPQQIGTLTDEQKAAEGFPLPASDPEGPATFDEYIARIHPELAPTQWFWAYRGLTRVNRELAA